MAKVFVITGPSGVGKGTLIAKLLEQVPDPGHARFQGSVVEKAGHLVDELLD